jgi:hypothetical protein
MQVFYCLLSTFTSDCMCFDETSRVCLQQSRLCFFSGCGSWFDSLCALSAYLSRSFANTTSTIGPLARSTIRDPPHHSISPQILVTSTLARSNTLWLSTSASRSSSDATARGARFTEA